MYLDANGLIVQSNGDGGDTCARTGQYYFALKITPGVTSLTAVSEFNAAASHLQPSLGTWVRNPTAPWNDPTTTSRDQTDPILIACGAYSLTPQVKATLTAQFKRFGMYQNKTDVPIPTTIGIYIRALSAWYLYPLLLLTDIAFILNPLFTYFPLKADPSSCDDNNAIIRMTQAAIKYPTPFSYLGRKLYAKIRPVNNGCIALGGKETNPVMGALAYYFDPKFGGNPEIAEAWRPIINKYFS